MSAAVTFLLALILLLAFVLFRFWEEGRGKRVWAHTRKTTDDIVEHMYRAAVLGGIPREYRYAALHFLSTLAHDTVVFLVEGLRSIEKPLARLSYRLRHSAPAATGKEPSEFLKTITPVKDVDGTVTTEEV